MNRAKVFVCLVVDARSADDTVESGEPAERAPPPSKKTKVFCHYLGIMAHAHYSNFFTNKNDI